MSAELSGADRFRAEEERAIASLASWIGHPAIPAIVRTESVVVRAVVKPLERLLTDQFEVIGFCLYVFGMAPVGPGWKKTGHVWWLKPTEVAAMEPVSTKFGSVVVSAADMLAAAGVPLEPSWPGDLAVVAEMLLLEATDNGMPWELSPRQLAEILQPPANSAIAADGSGSFQRRWANERAERNTTALRRDYEQHLHGPRRRAAYAGGGKRTVPRPTEQRRAVMRQVLVAFPEVSPAAIINTWNHRGLKNQGEPATPGGYLRHLLGGTRRCPSRSTLAGDLRFLEADDSSDGDEEQSS